MVSKEEYVIHTPQEIEGIRIAAAATAGVRDEVAAIARVGMSTKELDDLAGMFIRETGGTSAFLGYHGFPGQICISVNDEVVHGIGTPQRIIEEGDIVSIDLGVKINGCIGDTATSFVVGRTPTKQQKVLLDKTKEALMAGIDAAVAGNYIRDISAAVEGVAKKARLGVVRDYVGHGVGCELHEPPEVPNYVSRKKGPKLLPGMVLAIEPMFNLGTHKVKIKSDGWTVVTRDKKLSAHFEHIVLITENKPEILTWQKK
jgi:methionyl aminopeptidase